MAEHRKALGPQLNLATTSAQRSASQIKRTVPKNAKFFYFDIHKRPSIPNEALDRSEFKIFSNKFPPPIKQDRSVASLNAPPEQADDCCAD
jgi:hypothetical protein